MEMAAIEENALYERLDSIINTLMKNKNMSTEYNLRSGSNITEHDNPLPSLWEDHTAGSPIY